MPISRLIFFPEDSNTLTETHVLIDTLSSIELIENNPYQKNHYLAGEKFLNLITFLGCSPNINLVPVENESHCYISILPQTEQPICLGYTRTIKPKCPNCKKRIADWETKNWTEPGNICLCDKCQVKTPYAQLNWKQECGFARSGFEITHIYPHEAVPSDQLLLALENGTAQKWNYCYANN